MKKMVLTLALLMIGTLVFAQTMSLQPEFVSGRWSSSGGRIYQNDENARLAKANVNAPQKDVMVYEFDVRYEGGIEDGHGGFGLHVFADSSFSNVSWGAGRSYLLWLNYDENPVSRDIPAGFSAQLYRSTSNSSMDLIDSIALSDEYVDLWEEFVDDPVPFKITVNGNNGEIEVIDPTDYTPYYLYLKDYGASLPITGDWFVMRTNGIKLSFGY